MWRLNALPRIVRCTRQLAHSPPQKRRSRVIDARAQRRLRSWAVCTCGTPDRAMAVNTAVLTLRWELPDGRFADGDTVTVTISPFEQVRKTVSTWGNRGVPLFRRVGTGQHIVYMSRTWDGAVPPRLHV